MSHLVEKIFKNIKNNFLTSNKALLLHKKKRQTLATNMSTHMSRFVTRIGIFFFDGGVPGI